MELMQIFGGGFHFVMHSLLEEFGISCNPMLSGGSTCREPESGKNSFFDPSQHWGHLWGSGWIGFLIEAD
jgi:hypothetical protein